MFRLSVPEGSVKWASRRFDIRPVNSPNSRRCDGVTSLRFTLASRSYVGPPGRQSRTPSCSLSLLGPAGPVWVPAPYYAAFERRKGKGPPLGDRSACPLGGATAISSVAGAAETAAAR